MNLNAMDWDPPLVYTHKQMNDWIKRMEILAKQDDFSDDEYIEIGQLANYYYYLPGIDDEDTPQTIKIWKYKGGIEIESGDGFIRNQKKYKAKHDNIIKKIENLGKFKYYEWLVFKHLHPKPNNDVYSKEKPNKVICCLCGLIMYWTGKILERPFYMNAQINCINGKYQISGGYGSTKADGSIYEFVILKHQFRDNDEICDWCINDMTYSGEIKYILRM